MNLDGAGNGGAGGNGGTGSGTGHVGGNAGETWIKYNINGTDVLCVVDTDLNKVRSAQDSEQYDGIFLTLTKLYVKKTDLPKRPVYGKVFRLDEKPYTVVDCADEAGVWVITLGLNDG